MIFKYFVDTVEKETLQCNVVIKSDPYFFKTVLIHIISFDIELLKNFIVCDEFYKFVIVVDLIVLDVKFLEMFVILEVCLDQRESLLDVLHVYQVKTFKASKLSDCFDDILYVLLTQGAVLEPEIGQLD